MEEVIPATGLAPLRYLKTGPSFDRSRCEEYTLGFQAGIHRIQIAICDSDSSRCLALADLRNPMVPVSGGLVEQSRSMTSFVDRVTELVPWTLEPFRRKVILWEGSVSTLVPEEMMLKEERWEYLAFGHRLEAGEAVLSDRLGSLKAFNLFTIPEKVRELLSMRLQQEEIRHVSSPLIGSALKEGNRHPGKPLMHTFLSEKHMDIVLIRDKELLLHNRYSYITPEDCIYYILYVIQQFGIEPGEVRVMMTGLVAEESPLWKLVKTYTGHPEIVASIHGLHVDKGLEEVPLQAWYCLLNACI